MPNSQEVDLWRRFFFDDVGYNPCCSIYFMSSSTREVARFICVLGEYLSEEVLRTQVNHGSLTRPSAPAMVGGRCHDDHLHGGVVELFSSEVSFSIKEVVMKFGEAQCNLRRLDSRCVRVLAEIGHLRLQPSAERVVTFQPGEQNQICIKFFHWR